MAEPRQAAIVSTVGELARAAGGRLIGDEATPVGGVVCDSRRAAPGVLFAALRGFDVDGHDYVGVAIERGATSLLVERELDAVAPRIVVEDSRAALAKVAATFFRHPSREVPVVGITGTDGKTTTSFLVDALLRSAGLLTGMIGTVAVRIGDRIAAHETRQTTPESVDVQAFLREMVEAGVSWAIVEATSHGLAMHRLDEVRFRVAAVTNVTHEHLDYHGSIDGYRRAKAILFERVAADGGVAVVNVDDDGARAMLALAPGIGSLVRYSARGADADLSAVDVRAGISGSSFVLRAPDGRSARVALPMIGAFNVENAVCAAAVGLAAGLDLGAVARGLGAVGPVPGRMVRVDEGQPFSVVVDYAHTPDSLTKVLGLLRGLNPGGRLIAVFGSAGERDVEKRARQGEVAARLADYSVFTTEDPRFEDPEAIIRQIAGGAIAAGGEEGRTFARVTDRREAIRAAFERAVPGDCVLLAGKGHEGSIIWGREKRPWDEEGAARGVLRELGFRVATTGPTRPGPDGRERTFQSVKRP